MGRFFALAALGQLGFASKAIFIKLAYAASPTLTATDLLALRMLFSLPFFLLMWWWSARGKIQTAITAQDRVMLVWLGFVGYYLGSLFDFIGLQYISAALERVILFTNPSLVVIFSFLWWRQGISRRMLLALVLSYSGIVLAYWHELHTQTQAQVASQGLSEVTTGVLWVFASAIVYALYLMGGERTTRRLGSTRFTAYMMLVSTVFVLVQFASTRPLAALQQSGQVYILVMGMALFATVMPVWMMAEALKQLGANHTAMVGSLGPVLTIGLGVVFLNETISMVQILGIATTVLGVYLVTGEGKRQKSMGSIGNKKGA
ncbi:MAG: hypothetical protein RLZZ502_1809 [Pseudomonadota bacterium]|jgi:drug/metabolite transporter (DMT)-like permease